MCETQQLMVVTRGDGCETSLLHDSKLLMILHSISTPRAQPQGRLGIKACIIKISREHTFTPHGKLGSLLSSSTFNNITRRSSEYVQVVVNAGSYCTYTSPTS